MNAATSSRVTGFGWLSSRKRVRAAAMSAACWYRSSGSRARALRMIRSSLSGIDGSTCEGGVTFACCTFSSTEKSDDPTKSLSPVHNSYKTTPAAKMSLRPSSGSPRTCSGLMYPNFPLRMPACVLVILLAALAMPKSINFTSPSYERMMFCGLTSRWTMCSSRPLASRLR